MDGVGWYALALTLGLLLVAIFVGVAFLNRG